MTNNYNTAPTLAAANDGSWVCPTCHTSCIDTMMCSARTAAKQERALEVWQDAQRASRQPAEAQMVTWRAIQAAAWVVVDLDSIDI